MASSDIFAVGGSTASISVTSTSASTTLDPCNALTNQVIRIYNVGPNTAFLRWGNGSQTAVTTDTPIPMGAIENFFKGSSDTIAAVCASGQTATVYVTPGNGH